MRTILDVLLTVVISINCFMYGVMACDVLHSIENRTTTISEPVVEVAYEEQEEIVFVTREVQEDGDIIFEYGDVSDDAYFFVIVNIEQGQYEYYWPTMCEDRPLEYDSLAELNESITCHIDQEWPNATFVMR